MHNNNNYNKMKSNLGTEVLFSPFSPLGKGVRNIPDASIALLFTDLGSKTGRTLNEAREKGGGELINYFF